MQQATSRGSKLGATGRNKVASICNIKSTKAIRTAKAAKSQSKGSKHQATTAGNKQRHQQAKAASNKHRQQGNCRQQAAIARSHANKRIGLGFGFRVV